MANSTIQQLPLSKKLTPAQQERRQRRIQARVTVAEALTRNQQNIGLSLLVFRQQVARTLRVVFALIVALFLALVGLGLQVFGRLF